MKLPSIMRKTCPKCKVVTDNKVTQIKAGKASSLTKKLRRKDRKPGIGSKGKFSKVPAKKFKKSKWPHILLTCKGPCKSKRNISRRRCIKYQIK